MSLRRPAVQPTKWIDHPHDPTIRAMVRRPTRPERIRFDDKLLSFQRTALVYDKDGEIAKNDRTGAPITHSTFRFPLEMVLESLRMTVERVDGLRDANDQPIEWKADDEHLLILTEEWLDVTKEIEIEVQEGPEKGTKKKVNVTVQFGRWLVEEVAKPETWDSDPKTNGSAKQ